MSIALEDALQKVELELGKTYKAQVNGRWVVLRVLSDDEYWSAEDWIFCKVVSPGSYLQDMYPNGFEITDSDLKAGDWD